MRLRFPEEAEPHGEVQLPVSKSIANRLLVMAALAGENGPAVSSNEPEDTVILGRLLNIRDNDYDVQMAGTAGRFLAAYLCLKQGTHYLYGDQRMHERPMKPLVDALKTLGARIDYLDREGFLPFMIRGKKLKGGSVEIPGNVSSQFISALLMIGPKLEHGLELKINSDLYSASYVAMTIDLMRQSGAKLRQRKNVIRVEPSGYLNVPAVVECDWSAASYFYSLVALCRQGDLQLNGLVKNSMQGDARCVDLFAQFGVQSEFNDKGVHIFYSPETAWPEHLELDCREFPDLVQTLACTCAGLQIPALFTGVRSLRVKETDRLAALKTELNKLGVQVKVDEDALSIERFVKPKSKTIETFNDHRMAMAFAPLAVIFPGIKIVNPGVVKKSFPDFWNQFSKLWEPGPGKG